MSDRRLLAGEAMVTWQELLAEATAELGDRQGARWLLEEASGEPLVRLLARGEETAPATAAATLRTLVGRRLAGEPLQHVLGRWPFAGAELIVDRRALVPRPETEALVAVAIEELSAREPEGAGLWALDLGTGSGAIACALLLALPGLRMVAVDRSAEALSLAEENRRALPEAAARRLHLVEGSWYGGRQGELASRVHLVVSNPPYIAASEWAGLDPVVRDHDPYEALVAGPTGLEAIEAVLAGASAALAPGGAVTLELAPAQAEAAALLAERAGARTVAVVPDLAGRPRVLVARW